MGSNVTPPYANTFMNMIEMSFICNNKIFLEHCQGWFRFVDDVFAVWGGEIGTLLFFDQYLNYLIPGLKFNMVYSGIEIPFLDTMFKINQMKIESDLYVKSTDRNQLLHFDSFHPQSVFNSIPKSQLMRVPRIVSDPQCREERLQEMETKLINRNYPEASIRKERLHLNKIRTNEKHTKRIPFVTQFHPFSHMVFNIIKKHWN